MKILKIVLVVFLMLFLSSCGSDETGEDKGTFGGFFGFGGKKEVKVNNPGNNVKVENKLNNINNNVILTEEVVFLSDNTKTGKEKIDFIKEKLDNNNDSFKEKDNIKKSLDVALDYLEEKKEEEKLAKVGDEIIEDKIDELITEQEEAKEIIDDLIEQKELKLTEKLVYEGELELVDENFEEALDKFEEAFEEAETDEEKAEALAGEGDVHQEMGNDEEAEEAYEEALTYDDENVDANLGDAKYNIDQDLLDEAEANLQMILEQELLDQQSIELGVLNALILSLKGRYRDSDKILLGLLSEYGDDLSIYMLLIENNYFFSMGFRLDSIGLPVDQVTPVMDSYREKGLTYFNKAIELDVNSAYAYFYHGAAEYLLGNKTGGIIIIRNGLLTINNDSSLNTQEKRDTFSSYVAVIEKINIYNTTFDYTVEQFDVIVQNDIGIFEKFYPMIDKDRLEELSVKFGG